MTRPFPSGDLPARELWKGLKTLRALSLGLVPDEKMWALWANAWPDRDRFSGPTAYDRGRVAVATIAAARQVRGFGPESPQTELDFVAHRAAVRRVLESDPAITTTIKEAHAHARALVAGWRREARRPRKLVWRRKKAPAGAFHEPRCSSYLRPTKEWAPPAGKPPRAYVPTRPFVFQDVRSDDEREADEIFHSLRHELARRSLEDVFVRVALTTRERDLLSGVAALAMHVIGGRGWSMWYRATGYGFSTWLFGAPPSNLGHYLMGPSNVSNGSGKMAPSSVAKDAWCRYTLHLDPGFDDPNNVFFPLGDDDTPPPEYPCATPHEVRLRNINGRPNETLGRHVAGKMHGKRLADRANSRSLARQRQPSPLAKVAGSIG